MKHLWGWKDHHEEETAVLRLCRTKKMEGCSRTGWAWRSRTLGGSEEDSHFVHHRGTATSPSWRVRSRQQGSQSSSMEHWVQTIMMGRPGEALATPRRDGMLSTFKRLDAVKRNWQKGWKPDVKWSRQPMTPKHLKKPWKKGYSPPKWKSLHPKSRVNRANRTRIWHIYN